VKEGLHEGSGQEVCMGKQSPVVVAAAAAAVGNQRVHQIKTNKHVKVQVTTVPTHAHTPTPTYVWYCASYQIEHQLM